MEYDRARLFKGIPEVVKILSRKYTLAIVSTTRKKEIRKKMGKEGILKFFKAIIGADDSSEKKKKIKRILKTCRVKPSNAIIIGDTETEVKDGRKVGVKSIGVTYGWYSERRVKKAKPDAIARKPSEIPKLVEKLFN